MTFYFAASQLKLLQMHRRTAGVLYKQQMYPLGIIQIFLWSAACLQERHERIRLPRKGPLIEIKILLPHSRQALKKRSLLRKKTREGSWPIVTLNMNSLRERKREGWEGLVWFSRLLFAYLSLTQHKQPPLRGVNHFFNKVTSEAATSSVYWMKEKKKRVCIVKNEK